MNRSNLKPDEYRKLLLAIDKDCYRGNAAKKWASAPWLVEASGVEWAVATEGHFFVMIRRDLVGGECFEVPDSVKALAVPAAAVSEDDMSIEPAVLAEFVNAGFVSCDVCQSTRLVTCDDCHGTGNHERECEHCPESHDCVCDACDNGWATCEECEEQVSREAGYSMLLGGPINRDLIRRVLPVVDWSIPIRIALRPLGTSSQPVFIFQQDRQMVAAVMSLHRHVRSTVVFENRATWNTKP